ncbi:MAG: DUF512 domain-containing protein [Firmicutes bacterium]|jgi:putative radical SAM enzyme (TIGR03279 family)|nr:DUF512 domain-containing protein [Bacillota bacterium]MDH7495559.1 DUF512 domain-containing protein [Bacillota bacterium]
MPASSSRGAVVSRVEAGSIADEAGIVPGDRLVAVNGRQVRDVLEYRFLCADEELSLEFEKSDGEVLVVEVAKDFDESCGLEFTDAIFDGVRRCRNRCVFCFVDQLPRGVRRTLRLKDDDFRLSFMTGSYITLTNFTEEDYARVASMRLSPLYVSVHSTNPATRGRLLGRKRQCDVMRSLARLVEAGIVIHTQVVLCPGLNDGSDLEGTVRDLRSLFPGVRSCAVVPVGLTRHRRGLPRVAPVLKEDAARVIADVERWQRESLEVCSYRFVFASDELYLRAGRAVPGREAYEDFPQIENGVGLLREFIDHLDALKASGRLPEEVNTPTRLVVVTGEDAYAVVGEACRLLERVRGLSCRTLLVKNAFFGPGVRAAGLLTGRDIARTYLLAVGRGKCDAVVIPSVSLKADEPRFLDDMTVNELQRECGVPVEVVSPDPASLAVCALRRGGCAWEPQ